MRGGGLPSIGAAAPRELPFLPGRADSHQISRFLVLCD